MTEPLGCIVCQRAGRIPNRPPVCDGDRQALGSMLREIPDLFTRLDPSPAKGGGEKVSGSRVPPVPLNVDVADLTNHIHRATLTPLPSLHPEDQVGYLAVATELDFWVQDWRLALYPDHSLPLPTVAVLAGWLANRLEDACDHHPAIDEFAAKVKAIHRALIRQVSEHKRTGERVGRCPVILRDDTRCNTPLYVDPYVSQIGCNRCRTTWSSWLELSAAMPDDGDEEAA